MVAAGDLPDDPSGAVNYLLSGQGANGSWSDNAEATIYALQALQSTQPDLIIVAGSVGFSNDEPSAGDVVEVTAEVRNAGLLVSGDFQVQFYNGDPAFGGTGIGDPIDVSSLAPGESITVSVQWNTSSAGGSTNVYCVADSGDAVAELNESNNAAYGTAFVLSETDLVITAADITFDPSAPVEGDDVSMRVRIRNQGRDAENVFVHILEGTRLITGGAFPFIAERQQVIFTIPLRGLPQGKHDFRVVIDPDNLIDEANEDNNEAIGSIRVSAKRDLFIAQEDIAFVPGNPLEGDQVTVSAVVHNEGDEASENVVVQFFKGNPETGGTQLGNSQTLTNVPANGSASTQVRFDTTGLSGSFDIYVLVDATDVIPESNENNNAASKSISIARNIDLTVADSSILFSNDRPEDGDTITITATAKNAGVVPVSNVKVQFYDGPPSTLVPSWPLQTTGSILSSPIFCRYR